MCYNVTAPLDFISFEKEYEIARLVRRAMTVGRVIVFGVTGNTIEYLYKAEEIKEGKLGLHLQNRNLISMDINAFI